MLFDSSLRKELTRSFGGTLVVILTIVLTMMLIRTLGLAAKGSAAPQDVVLLLGYTTLSNLPILLCLSLFVAIVSTLTRLYRDSEMAVWLASGVSLKRFVRPVWRFVWPIQLLVAVLALVVWPWTHRHTNELRERYEQRSDLSRVAAGEFQASADGKRVFFIDKDSPEAGTGRNIFILDQREDREGLTTAQAGRIVNDEQGRMLLLDRGSRTELDGDGHTRTMAHFEHYQVRISENATAKLDNLPPKARSTLELLADGGRRAQGEMAWRIGLALVPLNLMLLGVGMAAGSHRKAGGWTLLSALLTFIVYLNLVNLNQAWVGGGKVAFWPSLLAIHLLMLTVATSLLWWRSSGSARWRSPLSRRKGV